MRKGDLRLALGEFVMRISGGCRFCEKGIRRKAIYTFHEDGNLVYFIHLHLPSGLSIVEMGLIGRLTC